MSITTALMATSALSTAATSFASSKATTAAANYESSVQAANARMATIQAEDAIRRGESEVKKLQMKTKSLISTQRAIGAAQGQELEGPESDYAKLTADTAMFGAWDVLDTRTNAWREAYGYRHQANQYTTAAKMTKLTGKATARNTLLTGGMNVARSIATAEYMRKNQYSWSLKDLIEQS